MLEAAGLSDSEERVYLALIGRRTQSVRDLLDATKLSRGAVLRTLGSLLEMGLRRVRLGRAASTWPFPRTWPFTA